MSTIFLTTYNTFSKFKNIHTLIQSETYRITAFQPFLPQVNPNIPEDLWEGLAGFDAPGC
jgi:hypothetical protein